MAGGRRTRSGATPGRKGSSGSGHESQDNMATRAFYEKLIGSRYAWLLVDEDGTFRLATPTSFPPVPGLSTENLVDVAASIRRELPGWGLIVSVPKSLPGRDVLVRALLASGSRALGEAEWESIRTAGMEVPFGDWASSSWAELFVLEEEVA